MQTLLKCKSLLLMVFIVSVQAVSLSSCDKDDIGNGNSGYGNENTGHGNDNSETKNIEKTIKDNVKVSASYSDYMATFVLTSTLKFHFSEYKYGIGHLSVFYQPEFLISVENDAFYYSENINEKSDTIIFKIPFWYYYAAVDEDEKKWADCEFYYRSFVALEDKGISNLTAEERDLYDSIRQVYDDYEREARLYYKMSVGVFVNSKFYTIGEYMISDMK